MQNLD